MRPINLLPIDFPEVHEETPEYFYTNVVKPLIPTFIRIMGEGITLDKVKVEELGGVIDSVLEEVKTTLAKNSIIIEFQKQEFPKKFKEYKTEVESSMRDLSFYLKKYDPKNATHRTYLVNEYLITMNYLEDIREVWSVKDLKAYASYREDPSLNKIVDKNPPADIRDFAMTRLAQDKMNIWNKVRTDKVKAVKFEDLVPPFNPGSSTQKTALFEYLKIEPINFSKDTGNASWDRDAIEQLFVITTDEQLLEVLQAFVDYSFSAIIKQNFLEGFESNAIDGITYSNLKLFGTKTFRPTANNINFLQLPSTGSIYAKPLKQCLVAPPGYLTWAIDLSALEDRIIANLSGDENKLAVFTEGLDGHSLSATYYFPDRVKALIGEFTDNKEASIKLKTLVDSGNKVAKSVRQDGKPVTFGLSYGAFPKKVANTIKCSLKEAEAIFNAYHNEMYPQITQMRDKALQVAKQKGYLHLGLGCRIYSDDIDKDSRTLFNSLSQFWSVITLLALDALYEKIDNEDMGELVKPNATIYDAIYGIVKADAESIKWLNDTIVPLMTTQIFKGEIISNEASLDIGPNWSDVVELPNNATIQQIQEVIAEI